MTAPLDTVSWDVFTPFRGVSGSVEVLFAEKGRDGKRRAATYGRSYTSRKYDTPQSVSAFEVKTRSFLVFQHSKGERGSDAGRVSMSFAHIASLAEELPNVMAELRDGCYDTNDDGVTFFLTPRGETVLFTVGDMIGGASLVFAPIVFVPSDGGHEDESHDIVRSGQPGVRMYVNSMELYGDCSLVAFNAFVRIIDRFDLMNVSMHAVQLASTLGGLGGIVAPTDRAASVQAPTRVAIAPPVERSKPASARASTTLPKFLVGKKPL